MGRIVLFLCILSLFQLVVALPAVSGDDAQCGRGNQSGFSYEKCGSNDTGSTKLKAEGEASCLSATASCNPSPTASSSPMPNMPATYNCSVPFGTVLYPGDRIVSLHDKFHLSFEPFSVTLYTQDGVYGHKRIAETHFGSVMIDNVTVLEDGRLEAQTVTGERILADAPLGFFAFSINGTFGFSTWNLERIYLSTLSRNESAALLVQREFEEAFIPELEHFMYSLEVHVNRDGHVAAAAKNVFLVTKLVRDLYYFVSNIGESSLLGDLDLSGLARGIWILSRMTSVINDWAEEASAWAHQVAKELPDDNEKAADIARKIMLMVDKALKDKAASVFNSPENPSLSPRGEFHLIGLKYGLGLAATCMDRLLGVDMNSKYGSSKPVFDFESVGSKPKNKSTAKKTWGQGIGRLYGEEFYVGTATASVEFPRPDPVSPFNSSASPSATGNDVHLDGMYGADPLPTYKLPLPPLEDPPFVTVTKDCFILGNQLRSIVISLDLAAKESTPLSLSLKDMLAEKNLYNLVDAEIAMSHSIHDVASELRSRHVSPGAFTTSGLYYRFTNYTEFDYLASLGPEERSRAVTEDLDMVKIYASQMIAHAKFFQDANAKLEAFSFPPEAFSGIESKRRVFSGRKPSSHFHPYKVPHINAPRSYNRTSPKDRETLQLFRELKLTVKHLAGNLTVFAESLSSTLEDYTWSQFRHDPDALAASLKLAVDRHDKEILADFAKFVYSWGFERVYFYFAMEKSVGKVL